MGDKLQPQIASHDLQMATSNLQSHLLRAVDVGLAGVMFVAPLFLAGRHPVGQLAYVSIVSLTALVWCVRQCVARESGWFRSGAGWFLLVGLLVIGFQLVPLSSGVIQSLSPATSELLPLWSGPEAAGSLGHWSQLSLLPEGTRGALAIYLAHAMLFLVVVQRVERAADVERLLRWIALAAVAMAVIGLAQFLVGNGRFLWVYEHPFRDTHRTVKGAFTNENHFAQFLALGIGPAIWWLATLLQRAETRQRRNSKHQQGRRRSGASQTSTSDFASTGTRSWKQSQSRQTAIIALAIALGLVVFAGLLTFSRGGVVVILLAMVFAVGMFAWKSLLARRALFALTGVGVVVGAALLIYGYQPLVQQLETLGAGSIDQVDHDASRRKLWAADFEAFGQFPLAGTGGGSHAQVYPAFYPHYAEVEYSHAESGYVQILLEFGAAGIALLAVAVGGVGYWCVRAFVRATSPQLMALSIAVAAGIVVSLVHSIWDFVWYIPACMSLTVILTACACRLNWLAGQDEESGRPVDHRQTTKRRRTVVLPRWAWIVAAVSVFGLSVLIIKDRLWPAAASVHWERYVVVAEAAEDDPLGLASESTNEAMLQHVAAALRANPYDARANLTIAALYMQRFDLRQAASANPMPLGQVRDAVLASQFPSAAARDEWLSVAVGDNRWYLDQAIKHVRRALRLCPLQGEGYVYLAELAFLEDGDDSTKQAYIDQALRVRPHAGIVLVAAGNEAVHNGDLERGVAFWKQAFHQDPRQQMRLIQSLAPHTPASFFLTQFDPDLNALEQLYAHYAAIGREPEAREIGGPYVDLLARRAECEQDKAASRLWFRSYKVQKFLGRDEQALKSLRRAADCWPDDFDTHRALAQELLVQDNFDEAIEQIQWCLYRKPDDSYMNDLMRKARRGQLEETAPSMLTERDTESSLR